MAVKEILLFKMFASHQGFMLDIVERNWTNL